MHTHAHMHIHTNTHIHTCTHTCTHTHLSSIRVVLAPLEEHEEDEPSNQVHQKDDLKKRFQRGD